MTPGGFWGGRGCCRPCRLGEGRGFSAAPTPAMAGSASKMRRATDSASSPPPARSSASAEENEERQNAEGLRAGQGQPHDLEEEGQQKTRRSPGRTGGREGLQRRAGALRLLAPPPPAAPLHVRHARRAQPAACAPPASRHLEEEEQENNMMKNQRWAGRHVRRRLQSETPSSLNSSESAAPS